MVAFVNWN